MRSGELVVDLQSIAKFEHGFLEFLVFQECLSASNVLGFGFFGRSARAAHEQRGDRKGNEQRKDVKLSALSIFHYCMISVSVGAASQLTNLRHS